MKGNIAQKVALTLWGNAFLQEVDTRPFWQFAAGFEFCPTVQFETGSLERGPVALPEWFEQLKQMQADLRLRVPARGGRSATALDDGPGADFLIEASSPRDRWLWREKWTPGNRSWRAAYKLQLPDAASRESTMRLDALYGRLSNELGAAASFTARHVPDWEPTFRNAERILNRDHPFDAGAIANLSPPGFLDDSANRLLGACNAAWIFGGMGNFADNSYGSLDAQVTAHCNALFATYEKVLLAVANSTCRRTQKD